MKHSTFALATVLATGSFSAGAEIYRCETGGKTTYTDRPCAAGAAPVNLPAVTSIRAERDAPDLAKQYDSDSARQAKAQAGADAEWLKKRGADTARDAEIRKAMIEHRIVKGMTPDQVQRVLNLPAKIEGQGGAKERWIYQNGRERRSIAFRNGVVSADSVRNSGK